MHVFLCRCVHIVAVSLLSEIVVTSAVYVLRTSTYVRSYEYAAHTSTYSYDRTSTYSYDRTSTYSYDRTTYVRTIVRVRYTSICSARTFRAYVIN